MSSLTSDSRGDLAVGFSRLAGAWAAAAVGAMVVNLVIFAIAHAAITISPKFAPLASPAYVVIYTLLGSLGAVLIFALALRLSRASLTSFRLGLAAAVLVAALLAIVTATPIAVLLAAGLIGAVATFLLVAPHWKRPLAAF